MPRPLVSDPSGEEMGVRQWLRRTGRRKVVALAAVAGVLVAAVAVGLVALAFMPGSREMANVAPGSSMGTRPGEPGLTETAPAAPGNGAPGRAAPDAASPGPAGRQPAVFIGRQVVRNTQLTVEVTDTHDAIRQVRTAASAGGALVAEEQSGSRGAWLVLRVPVDGLDRLVEQLSGLGTVLARSGQVQDVTEQTVDLDARVASQQASVARIRALLAEAESIGDVVAIESELARREAELDSLVKRREALRDQVAMATLTLELRSVPPMGGAGDGASGFRDGFGAGWEALRALGAAAAAVAGFVVPFLPLIALVVAMVWGARRWMRIRARRPATEAGGPGSE